MRSNERVILRRLYVVVLLFFLLVQVVLFRNIQNYTNANEGIRRSNVVLIELQNVLFNLKDAETGSRGYILTHDTVYLTPFSIAEGSILESIHRLDSVVVDRTDKARVDSLRALFADMFRQIHEQLLLERTSDPGLQGQERSELDRTRAVMERIRANRKRMVSEIELLRDGYSPQVHRSAWLTPLMVWVYFVLAFLATVLLLWRLLAALRRTELAEYDLHAKMGELDREVRTREFAERSLRRVLDSSTTVMMAFRSLRNGQGAIVDFECILLNRATEAELGLPSDAILGRVIGDLIPGVEELFLDFCNVVESGEELDLEIPGLLRGAEWSSVHAVRLLDGFVVSCADITLRKRQQEDLLESDRLATTGRMARTIAHEVRNPLTNLRLALEQLVDDQEPEERERMAPYVNILQRNTDRIAKLITDLLESSKPKEVHLAQVAIGPVLEAAWSTVADRMALQQMEGAVEVAEDLPLVAVDVEQLLLVLTNICINAVEAMEPGQGRLLIRAAPVAHGVRVSVVDNGKGIAKPEILRLFEAFYSGRSGGMGLGLTAARSIVQAHGSRLLVESELGKGTTFYFDLPTEERSAK